MIKLRKKARLPEAANQNEAQQPIVGEADPGKADLAALAKAFEPKLEMRPLSDLKPSARNARTHSKRQIQQLRASIRQFGFVGAIVVDEEGNVLAGHGRLEAARLEDLKTIPTIQVKHLTPKLKRAFMLADNRLAELAGWDEELLAIELQELSFPAFDAEFNFEVTGFDTAFLDRLTTPKTAKPAKEEIVAELDRAVLPVSAAGDLWQLGDHLIYCGNALEEGAYRALLADGPAQLVFTDPPYNVDIDGHVCGLGSVRHREFQMASGEMSQPEFIQFLATFMRLATTFSTDGSIHYICMDWRHIEDLLAASRGVYSELKNLCVWNKTNAGMGTFYRSKHELVFVFKNGTAPHINNFGLGDKGRYRTNVWDYAGVNTFKRGRMDELQTHPTVKPLAMVMDALKDCSKRRAVVLDPFLGSGTTILAAEKTGRLGRGIELDPYYVDAAIGRWQTLTGKQAVHVKTGQTFDERAVEPVRPATAA